MGSYSEWHWAEVRKQKKGGTEGTLGYCYSGDQVPLLKVQWQRAPAGVTQPLMVWCYGGVGWGEKGTEFRGVMDSGVIFIDVIDLCYLRHLEDYQCCRCLWAYWMTSNKTNNNKTQIILFYSPLGNSKGDYIPHEMTIGIVFSSKPVFSGLQLFCQYMHRIAIKASIFAIFSKYFYFRRRNLYFLFGRLYFVYKRIVKSVWWIKYYTYSTSEMTVQSQKRVRERKSVSLNVPQ